MAIKATNQAGIVGTFTPPGVIHPYAGSTAPSGWLMCDGAEYTEASYKALHDVLNHEYDNQMNPTTGGNWSLPTGTNFRVPDYRGIFLRGVGTVHASLGGGTITVSRAGWQAHATRKNGLSASSSSIATGGSTSLSTGSDQGRHEHIVTTTDGVNYLYTNNGSWVSGGVTPAIEGSSANIKAHLNKAGYDSAHTHTSNISHMHSAPSITVGDGDAETRPHNKGVNYIIKY